MKRTRRSNFRAEGSDGLSKPSKTVRRSPEISRWPGDGFRYVVVVGIALIVLCTLITYIQTVRIPPIDYEDSYYLLHNPYVNSSSAFSRSAAVWNEPYFANFHPVTTTTWLVDRAFADKNMLFDGLPFRVTQLLYAVIAASLLIPLYRRLGIPAILSVLGATVFAVHPIHTEVIAWLSARKDLISLILIVLSCLSWVLARTAQTPGQWRLRHGFTIFLVLLAVLSKPIAVILPVLFIAYEFCAEPHPAITRWRWAERHRYPLLTRTLALTGLFLVFGGFCAIIFRKLLLKDPIHGGWLILVPVGLPFLTLAFAPSATDLAAFIGARSVGLRVLAPPFAVLSVIFGAGSAWTFWAQAQVGAIKGGLSLLPTLNLTFDAMLRYAGKVLVPANMSVSYAWTSYPYLSVKGLLGATLVGTLLWICLRLAGSQDRNRRLIAFGILWYLIAFIPVSNLVPTSTKMADRYLFVPSVGAILAVLALMAALFPAARAKQWAVCVGFVLVAVLLTAWSYKRTEVWCGKTTLWNGRPNPDLSLWTGAVDTDPENTSALSNLALVYLRFRPPQADQALVYLNRALQLSQATNQAKIAGDRELDLSPIYQDLGEAYVAQASGLNPEAPESDVWRQRKQAYDKAAESLILASQTPSGFAPSDARLFSRLAEAYEGQAEMDAQDLAGAALERRDSLAHERDEQRSNSEQSMRRARELLAAGNVPSIDPEYRAVMIDEGNIFFNPEVGASTEEKLADYRLALSRYQDAARLFPDDPRPFLYQGLCYERLTGIAQSPEEKQEQFIRSEAVLRAALSLRTDSPDYSPAMPYRALASLYAHINDFRSVLDSLRMARSSDPASADSDRVNQEIRTVEQYLASQQNSH